MPGCRRARWSRGKTPTHERRGANDAPPPGEELGLVMREAEPDPMTPGDLSLAREGPAPRSPSDPETRPKGN